IRDITSRLMYCRRDDVRRTLARKLEDELTQVSFHRTDGGCFESVVELDLLAHHGLRLHHFAGACVLGDLEDNRACFLGRRCPMDFAAAPLEVVNKLLEVMVEMVQRLALDFAGAIAQALEAGNFRHRLQAIGIETKGGRAKSFLQMRIAEGLFCPLMNLVAL